MFCPGCGKKVENNAEICPNCGKSLRRTDDNKVSKKVIGIAAAILAVLVLIAVTVLIVNNISVGRYNRLIKKGNTYLAEMDYDNGIAAFDEAIKIDPKRPDAYEGKVNIYIAKGDYESELAVINDGFAAIEGDEYVAQFTEFATEAYEQYADVLVSEGNYEEALEVLEDGNELMPGELSDKIADVMQDASEQQKAEETDAESEADVSTQESSTDTENESNTGSSQETLLAVNINLSLGNDGTYTLKGFVQRLSPVTVSYVDYANMKIGDVMSFDYYGQTLVVQCYFIVDGVRYLYYEGETFSSIDEFYKLSQYDWYFYLDPKNTNGGGNITLYYASDESEIGGNGPMKNSTSNSEESFIVDSNCNVEVSEVYYDVNEMKAVGKKATTLEQLYEDSNNGISTTSGVEIELNAANEVISICSPQVVG